MKLYVIFDALTLLVVESGLLCVLYIVRKCIEQFFALHSSKQMLKIILPGTWKKVETKYQFIRHIR